MRTHLRFMAVGLVVLLLAVMIAPAVAQEGGDGGIIIEGTYSEINPLNPITCTDTGCQDITTLTWTGLVGIDPETALPVEGIRGGMAESWDISEDGLTYTFNLRDDIFWSDGAPIIAQDYLYAWDAINSGVVDTSLGFVVDSIESVTVVDDKTLEIKFFSPDCTSFNYAGYIYPIPTHVAPTDFAEFNTWEMTAGDWVYAGPFMFAEERPAEQVSLIANQSYTDSLDGVVSPAGVIVKIVPDATVEIEQFLAGEINLTTNPTVSRRSDLRDAAAAGEIQMTDYAGDAWDYLAFNLADPENPQDATDENGDPIDQGHHPIFSDVRVRQAIAMAIDVDAIIDGAVFGEGTRMPSGIIPSSWAFNDEIDPIPYDPEAALALLDEAGWRDEDGDGILEAHGALYAEDGTLFEFTMITNEGNDRRGAIGTIIQDQLSEIGMDVDFQVIDFNALLDIQDNQTFDTIILGWRNSYPDDPDMTQLFTPEADVVGGGSNFTSYNNPEFTDLNTQARTIPGCDEAERAVLYREMQVILQEDLPYMWLFAQNGMYAASNDVNGFDPFPVQWYWNIDRWAVATP